MAYTDSFADGDRRRLACACARDVWHLLADERSRRAVEVAERYADGLATADDLSAAYAAASDAAAAYDDAYAAARERQAAWIRAHLTPDWAVIE